jgi:Asp-tRNA(Asn)/Glu-tRNA(Gln) amidotransferase A subunit family amidase
VVGRLRTSGDPLIEAAVDRALAETEFEVVPLEWSDLGTGTNCFSTMYFTEMWDVDHALFEEHPGEVGDDLHQVVGIVDLFRPGLETLQADLAAWKTSLLALFDRVELLALPTLPIFPPSLDDVAGEGMGQIVIDITGHVAPFNAAGVPCSAQPVPVAGGRLPASLQLVGPHGAEELLLTTAALVEAAIA